jgi:hypothetical protein
MGGRVHRDARRTLRRTITNMPMVRAEKPRFSERLGFLVCGAPMEQKLAQQGQFKGQPFWSCTTFPKCRGIVHIERVA